MDPKKSELSDRLKKEFNEHLQNVMEKNKDYEYGDVLTSENFEEVSYFSNMEIGLKADRFVSRPCWLFSARCKAFKIESINFKSTALFGCNNADNK